MGEWEQDVLVDGCRFRTLNVLNIITLECLAIEVDTSLSGRRVARLLEQLIGWRGAPKQITLDNGPEFTSQALDVWAYAHDSNWISSIPANRCGMAISRASTANSATSASMSTGFRGLAHARELIEQWSESYDIERPHSAQGGCTPTLHAVHYQQARSLA